MYIPGPICWFTAGALSMFTLFLVIAGVSSWIEKRRVRSALALLDAQEGEGDD